MSEYNIYIKIKFYQKFLDIKLLNQYSNSILLLSSESGILIYYLVFFLGGLYYV